ncbi:MAG: cytochrome b [Rhodoplanes sp.]|uniref:cytochrome b n=1 Tax=Rhodoplanes sp. TaxID=1968906 RepID=UPI0017CB8955|nr:cytochrome b [Rhodoplanes sp.]NVO13325.1 cytochrome b [Rhodoplanes sp.]
MTKLRYDPLTQIIHWLTLIGVAGAIASGQIMEEVARGPAKAQLISFHMSLGVLVLALTLLRLSWRLVTPQPEPIPGSPLVQLAARAMHLALYAALVAVPVAGMLMVWAKGRSVGFFGFFTLPPLISPDRGLAETLEDVHAFAANLIMILAGVHAAAAIVHHLVLKDGAIARMLPFGEPRHG